MTRSKQRKLGSIGLAVLAFAGCHQFSPDAMKGASSGTDAGAAGADSAGASAKAGTTSHGDGGEAVGLAGSGAGGDATPGGGSAGQATNGGKGSAGEVAVGGSPELGGAGGEPGGPSLGAGGEPQEDPYCQTGPGGHPVIQMTASTDISNALTAAGNPYVLFMTQPVTSILSIEWNVGKSWVPWSCFDTVRHATRVAAGNGADGNLQVYSLTDRGALFVRQQAISTYDNWTSIALPDGVAAANDVAVRSGTLYLATPQGVFARTRALDESAVTVPDWKLLVGQASTRVAGEIGEDKLFVVMIDTDGQVRISKEGVVNSGVFSDPELWDYPKALVDVDVGFDASSQPEVFAATVDGGLISKTQVNGVWQSWQEVAAPKAARYLKSISVHSLAPADPYLFAIGEYDFPYMSTDGGKTWATRF